MGEMGNETIIRGRIVWLLSTSKVIVFGRLL